MRRCLFSPVLFVSVLSLAMSPTPACRCAASVVINEVLYDPDGPDTGLEFVEIVNCGRTGVSLSGWTLETGNGANPDDWTVEWVGREFDFLEPGGFFVIGEPSVVPEPDFVTALDLQNGPDAARLADGVRPVDVVGWGEPLFQEYYEGAPAPDVPSGCSVARSPDCYDHDDNSVDLLPAPVPTPGSGNSPGVDLSVTLRHHGNEVQPTSSSVMVQCVVRNAGALEVTGGVPTLTLLLDDSDVPVTVRPVEASLAPRDSVAAALECEAPPGYHRAVVRVSCPGDEEPLNDTRETSFTLGAPGGLVRLSEVMYSPDDEGTEWVELRNSSGESVDLSGWSLGDDDEQHAVSARDAGDTLLAPGGFAVVAKDTAAFGWTQACLLFRTERWEALSAGDVVVLLDQFGTPMERVAYDDSWGGDRGVSLERVRIDIGSDDPCNWGSSVDPSGSTPCSENSIFLPTRESSGRLGAAPNPFTPNGDGRSDRTAISYELPVARARVRISVYDALGRKRATLIDIGGSAATGEVLWDGLDGDGRLLPSGLYVVRLEAISAREGVFVDEKRAVGLIR